MFLGVHVPAIETVACAPRLYSLVSYCGSILRGGRCGTMAAQICRCGSREEGGKREKAACFGFQLRHTNESNQPTTFAARRKFPPKTDYRYHPSHHSAAVAAAAAAAAAASQQAASSSSAARRQVHFSRFQYHFHTTFRFQPLAHPLTSPQSHASTIPLLLPIPSLAPAAIWLDMAQAAANASLRRRRRMPPAF